MFDTTLSIDLGASYTKVALRGLCVPTQTGQESKNAEVLTLDGSPLIPSIAIQTGNASQPWVFGREAAQVNPTPKMRVFENWKANLFRPENGSQSAEAAIVASHFFGWLKDKVQRAGVTPQAVQVRVALPAFKESATIALVIARCMELSGWDSPLILRATEPHANMIGLFSSGKNAAVRNWAGTIGINYGATFDYHGPYVQAVRNHVLFDTGPDLLDTLVIDIGAFTVDFAALTFDFGTDDVGDGLKLVREESHALGVVRDLDQPVFTDLAARHGFELEEVSFLDRELTKRALYQNQPHTLLTRAMGAIRLGKQADQKAVRAFCDSFSEAIWKQVEKFMDGGRQPSVAFLTGGGTRISRVVDQLRASLRARNIRVISSQSENFAQTTDPWRTWEDTGEGLDRLATALGGASIVLQGTNEPPLGAQLDKTRDQLVPARNRATKGEPKPIPCRCRGGNKDCCFCAGRGYYFAPQNNA